MSTNTKLEGGYKLKSSTHKPLWDNKPLVSVVTVVYNDCENVEQTIKSIICQTYNNLEYIIVDGGSKDGTLEIVKKYEEQIAYWVSDKDKGIYDAMNKGIKLVSDSNAYLVFINSGDYLERENTIENVINNIDGEDFIYGNYRLLRFHKTTIGGKETNLKELSKKNICHQAILVKRYLFDKVGFFDINLKICADFDFILKVFNDKSITKKYVSQIIAKVSAGGVSDSNFKEALKERLSLIKKHYGSVYYIKAYINTIIGQLPACYLRLVLDKIGLLESFRELRRRLRI